MSEYQYYEFQAIDRPLTEKEMDELRSHSSRAEITRTSFINEYQWGNFKGDADTWMERYFDAFFYYANWGTHVLKLRLPSKLLSADMVEQYCVGDSMFEKEKNGNTIISFESQDDSGEDWEEHPPVLSSLIPIRAELARGDLRALYLGWLLCARNGEFDDENVEPPVPPNLGSLSASLQSLAEFLRIDEDLLEVAAQNSVHTPDKSHDREAIQTWVSALPPAAKDKILVRVVADGDSHIQNELLARYFLDLKTRRQDAAEPQGPRRRTVAELLAAAEKCMEERQRVAAAKAAQEKARREQQAALARTKHLDELAAREPKVWAEVGQYVGTKQPKQYDRAVTLLGDLRDLAARKGAGAEFTARLQELRAAHASKPSFIARLRDAGL